MSLSAKAPKGVLPAPTTATRRMDSPFDNKLTVHRRKPADRSHILEDSAQDCLPRAAFFAVIVYEEKVLRVALQERMNEHDPLPEHDGGPAREHRGLLESARLDSTSVAAELRERFVAENLRRIFLQIYRMVGNVHDAQDLTQEAFIKALQRQDQLKDELKAAHWLSRIATNTALDFLRRHGRV